MIRKLLNALIGPKKPEHKRSSRWPALSKSFLFGKRCTVCGGIKDLVAHHRQPVHLFPALELVETNLIPLCEGNPTMNCHLWFGHLGDFKAYNPQVDDEARDFNVKITKRPYGGASGKE